MTKAAQQQLAGARAAKAAKHRALTSKRDAIIRSRRRAGESVTDLARDYGLSRQAIYDIMAREDAA